MIRFLTNRFKVDVVDSITEPGPILALVDDDKKSIAEELYRKIRISIEKHSSTSLAIVAHHDCAANPTSKENQLKTLEEAKGVLINTFDLDIISLWVDETWAVSEIN